MIYPLSNFFENIQFSIINHRPYVLRISLEFIYFNGLNICSFHQSPEQFYGLSLPKYIGRLKFTGSRDIDNSKQGKFKENHTQVQQNQITESKR